MPVRAPSVCGYCGKAHSKGETCHAVAKMQKERKARFDQKRPTATQRGYNGEWAKARKQYLAAHPLCCRCGVTANVVDHIKAHKGNHALFGIGSIGNRSALLATQGQSRPQRDASRRRPQPRIRSRGWSSTCTPADDRRPQPLRKKFKNSSRFNERKNER